MSVTGFFKREQPLTRHAAHAAFWLFLALGAVLLAGKIDVAGHDTEWFLGYLAFGTSLALLVPTALFRYAPPLRKAFAEEFVGIIEALSLLAMMLSWIGSFGLYRAGVGYDTVVHFSASALVAIMLVMLTKAARPDVAKRPILFFLFIALITLAGGTINELFEWGGDLAFGTSMYGEAGQQNDTLRDFIGNIAGVAVGSWLGVVWAKRNGV